MRRRPPRPPLLLIYGSTGYTGELVVREAIARGLAPILAGRSEDKVRAQAAGTGLRYRVFPVEAPDLQGVTVLLNCAGPFSQTARPLVDACVRAKVHYLDITGEIPVFEALAARDGEARANDILLLPGVGFDVVPTDCLAAHLARRLPTARRLRLAFQGAGGISHGTAATMVEHLAVEGAARRHGRIVAEPVAAHTIDVDFGQGPRRAVSFPWGDVATAWYTTNIPDIEVFLVVPPRMARALSLARLAGPIVKMPAVRQALRRYVDQKITGPDADSRAKGYARIWGRVEDDAGGAAEARLTTPEGYTFTALSAVEAAKRVLDGIDARGFRTPAGAFGADFVLGFRGVERADVA